VIAILNLDADGICPTTPDYWQSEEQETSQHIPSRFEREKDSEVRRRDGEEAAQDEYSGERCPYSIQV
jgi:hypothetical protein